MIPEIEIIQALPEDAEAASAIMCEAALWLDRNGKTLWFKEELAPGKLKGAIEAGELHLVMMEGHAVGTVIFQLHDRIYWPDMPQGDAAYIHKVILKRPVAGKGLGNRIIEWARERAKAQGLTFLRLDTEAAREKLCSLYESAGFTCHSYRQVGRHYVIRYEMKIK
jgi:GNAT superfamily N-acetyltransferase